MPKIMAMPVRQVEGEIIEVAYHTDSTYLEVWFSSWAYPTMAIPGALRQEAINELVANGGKIVRLKSQFAADYHNIGRLCWLTIEKPSDCSQMDENSRVMDLQKRSYLA